MDQFIAGTAPMKFTISTIKFNHEIEVRDGDLYVNGIKIEDPERAGGITMSDGVTRWLDQNSLLHRDNDKPAIIYKDGSKGWYQNGLLHRDGDKPAIEYVNGDKHWYQNDKPHREGDKPAIESPSGSKQWYQNGKLHRDGDKPAYIECNASGKMVYTAYYLEGQLIGELGKR